MAKKNITDVDIVGKRVFIRVDFNVPIQDGVVMDDTRLRGALESIKYAVDQEAKVILASHLGRPTEARESQFSLAPIAPRLKELLGKDVAFAEDSVGELPMKKIASLDGGEILLLENVRYHGGEKKNDPEFAKSLAELADVYVNDAFGTAHRAHASTAGITNYLDTSVSGLLLEKELKVLSKILNNPERPFVAILGGAKVSDKIPVIRSLIERKVDKLLIGGAMAYTFFKAMGYTVGKSLVEDEMMPLALEIREEALANNVELILPTDHQTVDSFDPLNSRRIMPIDFTNTGLVGLDIGPESVAIFSQALEGAKTIIWNGPMGMFEEKPFDEGTIGIANAVADATDKGAFSVVGGGDSVAAINQAGLAGRVSHISTGGGATLEFLSGKQLPGVAALDDSE